MKRNYSGGDSSLSSDPTIETGTKVAFGIIIAINVIGIAFAIMNGLVHNLEALLGINITYGTWYCFKKFCGKSKKVINDEKLENKEEEKNSLRKILIGAIFLLIVYFVIQYSEEITTFLFLLYDLITAI